MSNNRKTAIGNITSHFRSKINSALKKIDVPEWELDIYYKTTSTLKEQSKIVELSQKGATVEALVETLLMKARNEDGTRMFVPADKTVLMNEADPDVLIRVVSEMNDVDLDDVAELEKN
jgi:hypothetical protein